MIRLRSQVFVLAAIFSRYCEKKVADYIRIHTGGATAMRRYYYRFAEMKLLCNNVEFKTPGFSTS